MRRKYSILSMATVAAVLLSFNGILPAADEQIDQPAARPQEQIYGSQLMTPEERAEHRARMRAAITPEEREQIRKEHHALMQERAAKLGITLPEEPPGQGMGPGAGMGPGPGMGPGERRGQ